MAVGHRDSFVTDVFHQAVGTFRGTRRHTAINNLNPDDIVCQMIAVSHRQYYPILEVSTRRMHEIREYDVVIAIVFVIPNENYTIERGTFIDWASSADESEMEDEA